MSDQIFDKQKCFPLNDWAVDLSENGVKYSLWLPQQETDYIQKHVANTLRPYEVGMLEDMRSRLSAGDHVLDIGANIGNHTIYLAAVAGCRVTAFEPNTVLTASLRKSIELNGLEERVQIVEAGAGACHGSAHFNTAKPENLGAQSLSLSDGEDDEIEIVALDELDDIEDVRLIKIDVEGMEAEVIEGAVQLIERDKPVIYIEALNEDLFLFLDRRLSSLGYCFWDTFNKDATHVFIHESDFDSSNRILQFHKQHTRAQYYRQAAMEGVLPRLHDLVKRLDIAWERFHQVSEELKGKQEILSVREIELTGLRSELQAKDDELTGLRSELQAKDDELTGLRSQLQTKGDELAAELERYFIRAEEAVSLGRALAQPPRRLDPNFAGRLRWAVPLGTALGYLLRKPKQRLADRCIALAKGPYKSSDFARLLLASLACTLDPRPFREKWYAFRLYESGLMSKAEAMLRQLESRVQFSNSEQRVFDRLKQEKSPEVNCVSSPPVEPYTIAARKPKKLQEINVALLCDEFTYLSFRDVFNPIILEPSDWRQKFKENDIDLFICESAWSGIDSVNRPWKGMVYASKNFSKENREELLAILKTCKENAIPTVFWNKEDPSHYEDRVHDFVKTAQLFDFIFTTDEDCVERYRKDYVCKNVAALPFAANPRLYNPIETSERLRKATFAGSWYSCFDERCADMHVLFGSIISSGIKLEIYDRYYGDEDPNHFFPDEYQDYIKPSVTADKVPEVFKSSIFGININSVKESPTMFARRVFELIASNTLVVSNYSYGMEKMFGDLVVFADREPLKLSSMSDAHIEKVRDEALHLVLDQHTYKRRFEKILSVIGVPYIAEVNTVTLVYFVEAHAQAKAAISSYNRIRLSLQGTQALLLLSKNIPSIDVQDFYIEYNRHGMNVVSEEYLLKYAPDTHRVIDTQFFALLSPEADMNAEVLRKAMLHRQYLDDELMQFGSELKYVFGSFIPPLRLVGPGSRFLDTIKCLHQDCIGEVYHV